MFSSRSLVGVVLFVGSAFASVVACGSDDSVFVESTPDAGGDGAPDLAFGTSDASGACTGIACQRVACSAGATTTVTGTVFAPNGTLPLYNVIVYVPQTPLEDIKTDLTCDRCGPTSVSGTPLVSTLSQANGSFRLENVPAGSNVPLVFQIGKWRRQVTLPTLAACQDNAITDANLTRLPKDKTEGSLPKMAVTTGKCDELACLIPKLGIAASEYTSNDEDGRLHIYQGHRYDNGGADAPAPDGTPSAEDLYASFSRYDIVMLSCECGTYAEDYSAAERRRLYDFVSNGGRLFASHLQYAWLYDTPLRDVATWGDDINSTADGPFLVDQSFEKGRALASWLVTVGASSEGERGTMPVNQGRESVGAVTASAQRWIYANTTTNGLRPESAKYFSVNAPVGVDTAQQCGKFVFADVHLANVDEDAVRPDNGFPASCGTELTPEEKALAFLFFDLASCVQDDKTPPVAPVK